MLIVMYGIISIRIYVLDPERNQGNVDIVYLIYVADIKHIGRATLLDTKIIYKYLHLEKRLGSV